MKRSIITRTLVAALAVAGAVPLTATVALANGNGNDSNHPVNDTWITTKVKAELATTDGVKSTNIDVKTVNGVVTLTGMLPTELAVKKAVAAAESIQGVTKVDHSGLKSKLLLRHIWHRWQMCFQFVAKAFQACGAKDCLRSHFPLLSGTE